ncbi:uncharacterized protein G2W53_009325 [Senna tora]|uniref:Uncharacterized protein n=1 Tax=Senna tora TaxID=362788 RepID=A0A835CA06_9FABA|nr:uncharacterized protein G2W53_009325 [Senna tora]
MSDTNNGATSTSKPNARQTRNQFRRQAQPLIGSRNVVDTTFGEGTSRKFGTSDATLEPKNDTINIGVPYEVNIPVETHCGTYMLSTRMGCLMSHVTRLVSKANMAHLLLAKEIASYERKWLGLGFENPHLRQSGEDLSFWHMLARRAGNSTRLTIPSIQHPTMLVQPDACP